MSHTALYLWLIACFILAGLFHGLIAGDSHIENNDMSQESQDQNRSLNTGDHILSSDQHSEWQLLMRMHPKGHTHGFMDMLTTGDHFVKKYAWQNPLVNEWLVACTKEEPITWRDRDTSLRYVRGRIDTLKSALHQCQYDGDKSKAQRIELAEFKFDDRECLDQCDVDLQCGNLKIAVAANDASQAIPQGSSVLLIDNVPFTCLAGEFMSWWVRADIPTSEEEEEDRECFNIPATQTDKVCNGRGECINHNHCVCAHPFAGLECELEICSGLHNDTKGCTADNPIQSCDENQGGSKGVKRSGLYYVERTRVEEQSDGVSTPSVILVYCSSTNENQNDRHSEHSDESIKIHAEDIRSEQSESDDQAPTVEISVPRKVFLQYDLKPKVISSSHIVFHDAQNHDYYERELKNPLMTIWILNQRNPRENVKKVNYSAKRIFEAAWNMNIQVKIMEVHLFDLFAMDNDEGLEHVYYRGSRIEKLPDVLIPRLGARVGYFGLAIVRQFEKMGVLVLNNHNSLDISRDKLFSVQQLRSNNFPIPKTMIAKFPLNATLIAQEFGFPLVMKLTSGSQGNGVILVKDPEHLSEVSAMVDQTKPLIVQQYIEESRGRDIRVIVIGGKAIGGMMRIAKHGWKSNFHLGGFVKKVDLSPELEWLATEAARTVGLEIAGVDILIDRNTYKICEVNSTPGFQGFDLSTGIDVAKKIVEFSKLRKGVWKQRRPRRCTVDIPVDAKLMMPQEIPQNSNTKTTTL